MGAGDGEMRVVGMRNIRWLIGFIGGGMWGAVTWETALLIFSNDDAPRPQ